MKNRAFPILKSRYFLSTALFCATLTGMQSLAIETKAASSAGDIPVASLQVKSDVSISPVSMAKIQQAAQSGDKDAQLGAFFVQKRNELDIANYDFKVTARKMLPSGQCDYVLRQNLGSKKKGHRTRKSGKYCERKQKSARKTNYSISQSTALSKIPRRAAKCAVSQLQELMKFVSDYPTYNIIGSAMPAVIGFQASVVDITDRPGHSLGSGLKRVKLANQDFIIRTPKGKAKVPFNRVAVQIAYNGKKKEPCSKLISADEVRESPLFKDLADVIALEAQEVNSDGSSSMHLEAIAKLEEMIANYKKSRKAPAQPKKQKKAQNKKKP